MRFQRVGIVLSFLNLLFMVFVLIQARSTGDQSVTAVVRARAMELVDERGQVRAQLNVESSNEVVFRLRDAKGTIRVKLGAKEDGSGLVLIDDRTEPTVQIRANQTGASMTLIGKDGQQRVIK